MYTIKPFSGPRYHENRDRHGASGDWCAICGKPIKNPATAILAPIIDGGGEWGTGNDDENDPGYMGCFSIGPDCHRRYLVKGDGGHTA